MRVLEAISDTNIGGAGKLLLTRLANSDKSRFTSAVVLPKESKLVEKFQGIGVKCYGIEGCADRSFDIGAIREISSIIRDFCPNIINAHGCMSARIAALLCRVPIRIYTRHCAFDVPRYMRCFPIKQSVGALSGLLSTNVIAVADAAADNLIDMGVSKRKILVIINGVDGCVKYGEAERERERDRFGFAGCFVVGICARLERCKDHATFLRAARVLSRKNDKYRFMIIGDGNEKEDLVELCDALGIKEKVIFTGFTDDVDRYYNCLDLNVNCSIGTETSSLALSEGMSIGLPSVASSFGGNPNMVRDGENGFIYEMGNFFELAERIERIAEDKELYERMSQSAVRLFETEFNSKKMTEETERLYLELFQKKLEEKRMAGESEL